MNYFALSLEGQERAVAVGGSIWEVWGWIEPFGIHVPTGFLPTDYTVVKRSLSFIFEHQWPVSADPWTNTLSTGLSLVLLLGSDQSRPEGVLQRLFLRSTPRVFLVFLDLGFCPFSLFAFTGRPPVYRTCLLLLKTVFWNLRLVRFYSWCVSETVTYTIFPSFSSRLVMCLFLLFCVLAVTLKSKQVILNLQLSSFHTLMCFMEDRKSVV